MRTLWVGCLWGMLGLLALAHVEGVYSVIVILVATIVGVISMYMYVTHKDKDVKGGLR